MASHRASLGFSELWGQQKGKRSLGGMPSLPPSCSVALDLMFSLPQFPHCVKRNSNTAYQRYKQHPSAPSEVEKGQRAPCFSFPFTCCSNACSAYPCTQRQCCQCHCHHHCTQRVTLQNTRGLSPKARPPIRALREETLCRH